MSTPRFSVINDSMKFGIYKQNKSESVSMETPQQPPVTKNSMILAKTIYTQTITLIKPPYLWRTTLVCTIMFCLGSSYYALMLWFPELFHRFGRFENNFPNESLSVCRVSQSLTNQNINVRKLFSLLIISKCI